MKKSIILGMVVGMLGYGPTWASAGTKFVSNHSGYGYKGKTWTDKHTKKY